MPLSQTPSILSLVWTSAHGLSPFYAEAQWTIVAQPGVLVTCGASGFAMGASSVLFDDVTGEPLAFQSSTSVTAAGAITMIGVWHYPAESCVVLAGVRNSSTASDVRVYAQRVYYDSSGNLTPDPLVTHSPSGLANGTWSAGPASSSTMHVMGQNTATVIRTATFDLAAGSVTTSGSPTVNSVFGGSLDRVSASTALYGLHGGAALLTTAYQNAAGAGTATTWVMLYTGSTPTATQVSASRMTATGDNVMIDTRTFATGISGLAASAYIVSNSAITAQAVPTDVFVNSTSQRQPQVSQDPGYLDSHNNENRDYLASALNLRRRVRMWNPDTGAEMYAWQYGTTTAASLFPLTGRLVARGEFWFNLNGANFQVWQGDFPTFGRGKWGRVRWPAA